MVASYEDEDPGRRGDVPLHGPHCGLDWMVDFDASFWSAEQPGDYGKGNRSRSSITRMLRSLPALGVMLVAGGLGAW